MILLPSSAICEFCGKAYSLVCRADDEKIYVAEHVETCGRQTDKGISPDSNSVGTSDGLEIVTSTFRQKE